TLYRGHAVAVAPKAHPPNYREIYELRWFHPAAEARSGEVTPLGERVPFGTDVLVHAAHLPGFVLHTDVCEDLWTPVPPGTIAALSWDGHGLVAERGEIVAETERFALAGTSLTVDVDPTVLVQERMRQSSW